VESEGGEDFDPAVVVNGFGVDEDAVEVEEDGIEWHRRKEQKHESPGFEAGA